MIDTARERLMAVVATARARPLTTLAVVAGAIIFLQLLSGNASGAILVALVVVPAAILFHLTRLDLYEREPWSLLATVVGAGALIGLLGGLLSAFFFERFWFSDSQLNLGAIGFSGIVANGEGSVPVGVVLLGGILIPVLTGAAILAGPIALRRWSVFRNEITDGMTLGGLAAAGFVTVSSFVYFWPSAFDNLPDRPVSQWTALLAGIAIVRPFVLILAGSLLGIAAWQYLATKNIRGVLVPGVAGVFGWLALPLGSLLLAQSGALSEFVWYVIVLIVVAVLFRRVFARSLATDQQVLTPADGEQRVVCPNCNRVTPDGSFCSFCRAPLHPDAAVALGSHPDEDQFSADNRDRSTSEPPTSSPDAAPQSVVVPVMATDAFEADDQELTDHGYGDSDLPPQPGQDRLGGGLDEPEADEFDYLDRSPSSSSSPVQSASSLTTEPPASAPSTSDSRSGSSPFRRVDAPESENADPVGTSGSPPDRFSFTDIEREPASDGDGDGQKSPISLQDWARRSETSMDNESQDPEVLPPPAVPVTSPWRRPADTVSETAPGLKWPTSAASSIDPPVAPTQDPATPGVDPDDGNAPSADSDSDAQAVEPEARPVESSSGRWFDASSDHSTPSPNVSAQGHAEERLDDIAGAWPTEFDATSPDETTSSEPARELADPVEESGSSDEPSPGAGLRWYRQDDEIEQAITNEPASIQPDQRDRDDDSLSYSPKPPSDVAAANQPLAPETETQGPPGAEGRTGIWRSITRQGRGGSPRAPHRDQNMPDDTP